MKKQIFVIGIIIFQLVCNAQTIDNKAYVNWIANPLNGLRVITNQNKLIYTLQLEPSEYLAFKDMEDNLISFDSALFYRNKEGIIYFNLQIKAADSNQLLTKDIIDVNQYYQRLNYLTFNFKNDISATVNGKFLKCEFCHMERTYQSVPYLNFSFGFKYENSEIKNITITINDQVWDSGLAVFIIKGENILKSRELALK